MHFVSFLVRFFMLHSGKLSLIFSFLAGILLPIFIVTWYPPFAENRLYDLHGMISKEPLQLLTDWLNNSFWVFKLDFTGIIYVAAGQSGIDAFFLFYALLGSAVFFALLALFQRKSYFCAITSLAASILIIGGLSINNKPDSFYANLQKEKQELVRLSDIIEDREMFGEYDDDFNKIVKSLADIYAKDDGIHRDYRKARRYYLKAANNHDRLAQYKLSVLYLKSLFPEKEKAREWMLKAIENETYISRWDFREILNWERRYQVGKQIPEVHQFLFNLRVRMEAISHSVNIRCSIARQYKDGEGVEQRNDLAYLWVTIAVEDPVNYSDTQSHSDRGVLERCVDLRREIMLKLPPKQIAELDARKISFLKANLLNGTDIEARQKQVHQKIEYERLLLAINNKNVRSEINLSSNQAKLSKKYHLGLGVTQNYMLALKWLKKAVETGDEPKHKYDLAMLYRDGIGDSKSDKDAYYWASVALAEREVVDIRPAILTYLKKYVDLRDELRNELSAEEVIKIDKSVVEYLDSNYPDHFKNGKKIEGVSDIYDVTAQKQINKQNVAQLDTVRNAVEEKRNAYRKKKNAEVIFSKDDIYPIKYYGEAKSVQMITWLDQKQLLYVDSTYNENKRQAYELVLFNIDTGVSKVLAVLSYNEFYAFDIDSKQLYYYSDLGNGKLLKRAYLEGDQLVQLAVTVETAQQYYTFRNRGQIEHIHSGEKLEKCAYYEDLYKKVANRREGDPASYYLCRTLGKEKHVVLRQHVFNSQVSLDGCRVFGLTSRGNNENLKERFILDFCKR